MKPLVIFDLDGTLADAEHRRHFVSDGARRWPEFFRACYKDAPKPATIAVARALHATGHELWLFSGRSDEVAVLTATWLIEHDLAHLFTVMRFRPAADHTPDHELKHQWYDEMTGSDRARLLLVFDDRDRLVKMWRALGVPCFQVADGDF